MRTGIEQIFITYANHPMRGHPENMGIILDEVDRHFGIMPEIRLCYDVVSELSGADDPSELYASALNKLKRPMWVLKELFNCTEEEARSWLDEHIFGYETESCEKECWFWETNTRLLREMKIAETDRLRCHECIQLLFIWILHEIIHGTEFTEIDFFCEEFFDNAPDIRQSFGIDDASAKTPFREKITRDPFYTPTDRFTLDRDFEAFLYDVAKYSLLEFLIHYDRRKLKKCPYCLNFFIAKDIKRQRCYSAECRKAFERIKKQKQRDKDPVKYY